MKKFYIDSTEVNVEISPTLAETLDESLDNMTLSLKIDQNEKPYEPLKHKLKVYDVDSNNNETLMNEFLITSDNVELVGVNPLRYKHTISLIQTSQRLTKHLIRNTVFSTSLETSAFSVYAAKTCYLMPVYQSSSTAPYTGPYSYANEIESKAQINLKKKSIKDAKLKLSFNFQIPESAQQTYEPYGVGAMVWFYNYYCKYSEPTRWSEGFELLDNSSFKNSLPTITFSVDVNGTVSTYDMTLQTSNYKNGEIIDLPSDVVSFLNSHQGLLTISIGNISTMTGWDSNQILPNKMPLLINVRFEVFIESVEKSVYDVIDTLLKQYKKETKAYKSTNDPTIQPLFNLPYNYHNKDLYDLLKGTSSPNFIFTQASMFDALAEIFKLFDATFRIDDEGYLDIEYFNEHTPREVTDSIKTGRSSALGEERYANRLLTFFQNTKIDDKFPNSNEETATAYLRSKSVGVPKEDDFVYVVPKNIDILKKVEIKCSFGLVNFFLSDYTNSNAQRFVARAMWGEIPDNGLLDITDNVLEEGLWSILEEGTVTAAANVVKLTKANCLYYTRGQNYINISAYYQDLIDRRQYVLTNVLNSALYKKYGVTTPGFRNLFALDIPDWHDVQLAVSYIALVDGKLVNESIDKKYDGEILTNQNNGSIDINKLGLNMVGLSLKLGQPTLTLTQKFTSWNERIKKGQFFIDNEGNRWVANTCSYTLIDGEHIQATIEFVKNFNGLASRIELNREKRLSNISNDLTTKCEENYGEFVYYCDEASPSQTGEEIALKDQFLRNSLSLGFGHKIQETNISTSYDASSYVEYPTLDSTLDLTQYTKKQLVSLIGYVGEGVDTDNPRGTITLWQNSDFTGESVVIPVSGGAKETIYLNEITKEFEVNYSYLETVDFNTQALTSHVSEGDLIIICLVVDNGEVLGGAITDDSNVPGLTGWFAPNNMILRYPENDYRIEYALLTALNDDNSIISLEETGQVKNIAVPMVVYGSGNSICFEMSYDSPISAGTQLLDNYTSIWQSGGWFSRHVLYTNEEGEAAKFTIDFVKMQEGLTRYFPAMKKSDNDEFLDTYSFGKLEEFAYYKKPNEIFALNYQIHFLPYIPTGTKQTFLSNEYIKNNGFANGFNKKTLHIVYTTEDDDDNFEYSILDIKGHGEHTVNFEFTNYASQETHKYRINFNTTLTSAELAKIKTWAIVDEKNNIYFASNNTPGASGFNITFIFRHHRI